MYSEENFPLQKETYTIIGIAMEIHKILGKGFLEIVYKDALEYELKTKNHLYEREKEFLIHYKEVILPHKFSADFVVFDKVILEVKAQRGVVEENHTQTINYLAASKCKIGLILNFGEDSLVYKRVIL
jgi:GxxExxY protein